ncbi:valine--tRNA ligase [Emydomyces testavorans]|uniref:Valine--tRNA ligase, mitochondrial n=1 Tax=Emydomyces testavorans TaxID=2070801 RepID=A0AAF0DD69_9EURO|nr:valine--tRNA ligase [Emydomyces testavorans]
MASITTQNPQQSDSISPQSSFGGGENCSEGQTDRVIVKSAKELEKERKKAEKALKFLAKQEKQKNATTTAGTSKEKTKKQNVDDPLPEYIEETPKGSKKILKPFDDAFHKAYIPQVVESAWYDWWEKEGFFLPEFKDDGTVKDEGYFVIPAPPPNVTGALHCGHAMAVALQDTMVRWSRMNGLTTLWVPGCDHAGISTQNVVEKMLWRRQKQTRHDLGRQTFTELVWNWKDEYHQKINHVLRRMGGSYDWSREAFTMDSNLSAAVTETFCRLHEEGYIYRSNRLVNWCTQLNTALSNLEVINKELPGRTLLSVPGYQRKVEFGVLVHFRYPIEGSEVIEVATTRPETILGDTGIAVHPNDSRYKHLVGKKAKHPFLERFLPIIADNYVDPEFGTGAVKITPAHDPNDFEMGKRHNLEFINILNDNGTMNHNTGKFEGQKRFDVRYSIVDELSQLGLFVKKVDNPMKVPLCEKSKDVIEPLMKPQWWMKMREMADMAIKAVKDDEIKIRPDMAEKSYFRWLENINDWCLSRQLWWGHQIPAYYIDVEGEFCDQGLPENEKWVSGRTEQEAYEKAEKKSALNGKRFKLIRDPDVLDTWFSSGLWPFSTLGWPKNTDDFMKLYPTTMLETGWDILFFWVARMIMLGLKLTGRVPFKEVYCHSLVRDTEGRKMSKSLGNVIDPIDIMDGIELSALHDKLRVGNLDPAEIATATKFQKAAFPQGIPECGADALRFCLLQYCTGGGDINFDIKVMHGYRRFCNKIYQATKYVLSKIGGTYTPPRKDCMTGCESLAERWILHKLTNAAKDINQALTQREFSKATQIAYRYWYYNLCDVFIENSKVILQDGTEEERKSAMATLYTTLEQGLVMIHPFMPFLSEELWQRLPRRPGDSTPSIMKARYPKFDAEFNSPVSNTAYELILDCSKGIRSLIAELGIRDDAKVFIHASDDESYRIASRELSSIKALSGKGNMVITILSSTESAPSGCAVFVVSASVVVFLDVRGRIVLDTEITRAESKLKRTIDAVAKSRQIVDAPDFAQKTSSTVQESERRKLADLLAEQSNYERTITQFEELKLKRLGN